MDLKIVASSSLSPGHTNSLTGRVQVNDLAVQIRPAISNDFCPFSWIFSYL